MYITKFIRPCIFTNEKDMVANLSYLPPLATFVYNSMCYVTQSSYNVSDNIQYNVYQLM